jgi:hypothetical protein
MRPCKPQLLLPPDLSRQHTYVENTFYLFLRVLVVVGFWLQHNVIVSIGAPATLSTALLLYLIALVAIARISSYHTLLVIIIFDL